MTGRGGPARQGLSEVGVNGTTGMAGTGFTNAIASPPSGRVGRANRLSSRVRPTGYQFGRVVPRRWAAAG